jgi:uncharacterized protein YdgA (DUF945 family)
MKKLIAGLLIIGVGIGLGIPFTGGMITQKLINDVVGQFNGMYQEMGYDMSIEIQSYERGIFTSQIDWKFNTGSYADIYHTDGIYFTEITKHGYTRVTSRTTLEKNSWFNEFVDTKLNGDNPLEISTVYPFKGNIETDIRVKAFSFDLAGGSLIEIKPGVLKVIMDKEFKQFDTDLQWQGCFIPERMTIQEMIINCNARKISNFLWDGSGKMVIDQIMAEEEDQFIELSKVNIDYSVDYNEADDVISMGVGYGVSRLDAGEFKCSDAMARLGFNHIDKTGVELFLAQYVVLARELAKEMEATKDDPEKVDRVMRQFLTQLGLPMIAIYEKMLKENLEIAITQLVATLPQGKIEGELSIKLKKGYDPGPVHAHHDESCCCT